MANPVITSTGLVTRFMTLALQSRVILDGADIAADGIMKRGTLVIKKVNGKWRQMLHADALVVDQVRILQDEVTVEAGKDAFTAAFFKGFFALSTILTAQPAAAAIVAGDLTLAAGFHLIETDEIELK
jgi:hypothetical protein